MSKFISVFNADDRDTLIAKGYLLVKSDKQNNAYVFENKNEHCFSIDNDIEAVYSDIMTF